MSYLNLNMEKQAEHLQNKEMFLLLSEMGIDISRPVPLHELIRAYSIYREKTGKAILGYRIISTAARNENGFLPAALGYISPDDADVRVIRLGNYSSVPMHPHENFEIQICVKGTGDVFFDGVTVHMQAGDAVIIPPYTYHCNMTFDDDSIVYLVLLRYQSVQRNFPYLFKSEHILSDFFSRNYQAETPPSYLVFHGHDYFLGDCALGDLLDEWDDPGDLNHEMLNMHAQRLLLTLLRDYGADTEICSVGDKEPVICPCIIQYIREHIDTVTLVELSERYSYSQRHITRMIEQGTGMNYSDYVRMLRMELLGERILSDNAPLTKIFEESGMSSLNHLYRSFRDYFGMTPKEYRERYGKEQNKAVKTGPLS